MAPLLVKRERQCAPSKLLLIKIFHSVVQAVECLPSKHEALNSNPSSAKKKEEEEEKKKPSTQQMFLKYYFIQALCNVVALGKTKQMWSYGALYEVGHTHGAGLKTVALN
jgi:hypothetical protein